VPLEPASIYTPVIDIMREMILILPIFSLKIKKDSTITTAGYTKCIVVARPIDMKL
jgi:hypothetical protein